MNPYKTLYDQEIPKTLGLIKKNYNYLYFQIN